MIQSTMFANIDNDKRTKGLKDRDTFDIVQNFV